MAEAAVMGMIQYLEGLHVTCPYTFERWIFGIKIQLLEEMLDFMRELKMEERSRLKYLMADLVELAQDVMDVRIRYNSDMALMLINGDIKITKTRVINFVADEKNIGDEEEAEEEIVVGLEENVKQLLDKAILNNYSSKQILCIKGMIGIGKTTLARQVYKAGAGQFQRHAWVSYSSNKEMLMKLIQQMVVGYEILPSLEEMDNRSLQSLLQQHLQGLSYFIVLDNVSTESQLDYILKYLPYQGTRSRLLVTSRYKFRRIDVSYTHEMKSLDSDKSWQLFLKTVDKITSVENRFSKNLERKGREMLEKCWGFPMAIIDVARQKAKQRLSGIEWEELFDSIDLSESLKLLEPMYHQLEEDIKPQFLLFSLFKENAIMREKKLEQIWAAKGLHYTRIALEFAEQSILEVVKQHYEKRNCRLNPPLLHMISIKKAEEKMGLEILRSNGNSRPSQNARHCVIHCGRDKFNHFTNENSKQLISLIFHGGGGYLDEASSSYWESFEVLKILDMDDFGVKTLSETIGALIELRYLGLRNNYIQEIPHSLGGLKKLEALDIAQNFMVEVPDIIQEMDGLRDLHMSNVIFRNPLKVDALQKLGTLAYISIYDWAYEGPGFETMYGFRTLGIEEVDENSDIGTLFATLAKFPYFRHLFIRGFRFRSMPSLDEIGVLRGLETLKLDGRIGRLPSADNLPEWIRYIALVNTCLDEDPMQIMGNLHSLTHLKLRNAYIGREMVINYWAFPKLEVLCIRELWNLRKIQVDDDAKPLDFPPTMRSLRKLEINNCPQLETLSDQIQWMPNLQVFKMVTTKHIATKIRNSGVTSKILEDDINP
ncbi:probable disease resistance protein At1g58602 isoform X2 [Salvia hispanica]|uniref:probable disease resistance protein At1g58602 isoform X2 n=1 Tax=Salvia hispanica TaxID=49212 RepID=UPI002009A7E2|nr:probable disease resistance protein At1g58602 isoform X2 [Salvia hispanica]